MTDAAEKVADAIAPGENLSADLMGRIGTATKQLEDATAAYRDTKTDEANEARAKAAEVLTTLQKEHQQAKAKADDDRDAAIDDMLKWAKSAREPSKAHLFGNGSPIDRTQPTYKPGAFIANLHARQARDMTITNRMKAETELEAMGIRFLELQQTGSSGSFAKAAGGLGLGSADGDPFAAAGGGFEIPQLAIETAAYELLSKGKLRSDQWARATGYDPVSELTAKATLGLTGATGGNIIPNATIGDLVKPGRYRSAVPRLVTGRPGAGYLNQIPVRVSAPTKAAVVAWGDTKTNTNLTYGAYTATMYTLAIIYDLAKQFVRFSAGAAEQDVLQELGHAFDLGQAYYILQGTGSSEPYGIQPAIATAFSAYTTAFTASATTLAGSVAKALASAAGDLAVRNRAPEAAVVGAAQYWNMVSQGTDTAGFFFAPSGGPLTVRVDGVNGGAAPWGIPVYPETQLAGTDDLLVGEWSALEVFYGESYRVDTSDEAGDRWDKNLIGFRGEMEMGLDARAAVFAGAFQFIADIAPSLSGSGLV